MACKRGGILTALLVAAFVGCGRASLGLLGAVGPEDDATTPLSGSDASSGGTTSSGGNPSIDASRGGSSGSSGSSSGGPQGSDSGSAVDGGAGSSSGGEVAPPSCAPGGPGMTNCGSAGESCCTSLQVSGGPFFRTYDPSDSNGVVELAPDGAPTGEADPATVSGFRLDKYLVTVGRFRQFAHAWAGGWLPPAGAGKHAHLNGGQGLVNTAVDAGLAYETGWVTTDDNDIQPTDANLQCDPSSLATWTLAAGNGESLPVTCENWSEAYAFCIWDGGFLPSEAEWVYAAGGGAQQRLYPWGSTDPGTASEYAVYDCDYQGSGPLTCSTTSASNVAPVGTATLGAGRWGQLDLAGEIWEWNLDWHATYVDPCVDCASLTTASSRAEHGGDYAREIIRPSLRGSGSPSNRLVNDGLRCARAP